MVTVRVVGVINHLNCVVSMLTVLTWAAVVIIGAVRAVVLVVAHGHVPIAYLSWSESVPRVGLLRWGFVLAGVYAAV